MQLHNITLYVFVHKSCNTCVCVCARVCTMLHLHKLSSCLVLRTHFLEFVYHLVFWIGHTASASSSTARIHLLTYGATWVGTCGHWAEDGNKCNVQKVFCSGHQTLDRVKKPSHTNYNMSLSWPSNGDLHSPKFVNFYVCIIPVAADKHIFIATTWKPEILLNNTHENLGHIRRKHTFLLQRSTDS